MSEAPGLDTVSQIATMEATKRIISRELPITVARLTFFIDRDVYASFQPKTVIELLDTGSRTRVMGQGFSYARPSVRRCATAERRVLIPPIRM